MEEVGMNTYTYTYIYTHEHTLMRSLFVHGLVNGTIVVV